MSPVERAVLRGDALLEAVTDAVVALHLRHHRRVPTSATTSLMGDDLLVCTLIGARADERGAAVDVAQALEDVGSDFGDECAGGVERLSGRRVTSLFAHQRLASDGAVELLVLARCGPPPAHRQA